MPSFGDAELIWTNIKRNSVKIFVHEYNGLIGKESFRSHPTQKPLEIIRQILLKYSKENDLIFDPFMGSGTTCVAAKELGRRYMGIDIEQKYVDIAKQRLAQEYLF